VQEQKSTLTRPSAQIGEQRHVTEHAVGDVVAKQHPVLAHRAGMKEAIKRRHTLHVSQRQAQPVGEISQHGARQPAVLHLRFA
jgi:hypothetical protein